MDEVQSDPDGGRDDQDQVKGRPVTSLGFQRSRQPEELFDCVSRRAREDRYRQQSGADHAQRKENEGERARKRLQRGGRLGSAFHVVRAMGVEDGGRSQHDAEHHDLGEEHSDQHVDSGGSQLDAGDAPA